MTENDAIELAYKNGYEKGYQAGVQDAQRALVHCGACEHWDPEHAYEGQGWCQKVIGYRYANWYCAGGKLKGPVL